MIPGMIFLASFQPFQAGLVPCAFAVPLLLLSFTVPESPRSGDGIWVFLILRCFVISEMQFQLYPTSSTYCHHHFGVFLCFTGSWTLRHVATIWRQEETTFMFSFGSVQLITVDRCIHIGWSALQCFNSNAGIVCLKKSYYAMQFVDAVYWSCSFAKNSVR